MIFKKKHFLFKAISLFTILIFLITPVSSEGAVKRPTTDFVRYQLVLEEDIERGKEYTLKKVGRVDEISDTFEDTCTYTSQVSRKITYKPQPYYGEIRKYYFEEKYWKNEFALSTKITHNYFGVAFNVIKDDNLIATSVVLDIYELIGLNKICIDFTVWGYDKVPFQHQMPEAYNSFQPMGIFSVLFGGVATTMSSGSIFVIAACIVAAIVFIIVTVKKKKKIEKEKKKKKVKSKKKTSKKTVKKKKTVKTSSNTSKRTPKTLKSKRRS